MQEELQYHASPSISTINGSRNNEVEVEVDGLVTSGGLGGLAILQALQRVSDISKACPMALFRLGEYGDFVKPLILLCTAPVTCKFVRPQWKKKGAEGSALSLFKN